MFRPVSTSFILFTWILALSLSSVVRGQVRVIGDPAIVRARVGDEVLLPCRCDPATDLRSLTVEWSRTDMRPDPTDLQKKVPLVHLHTDHCDDDLDMKFQDYIDRTKLFPKLLAAGVASLLIRNVTLSDSGTYKCFIPSLRKDQDVTLVVDPSVEVVTPTHDPSLIPKFNDSDSSNNNNKPPDRPHAANDGVFIRFCCGFIILGAIYCVGSCLKEPTKKSELPQSEEVCERGDSAPSERTDSAPSERTDSAAVDVN